MAAAFGISELLGKPIGILQFNRETPQCWIHKGPMSWAVRNGTALGCGTMSRIGFWLWYTIPTGAFLAASPLAGVAIYGTYGFFRGISIWAIMLALAPRLGERWPVWLIQKGPPARLLAAGALVVLGMTTVLVLGL